MTDPINDTVPDAEAGSFQGVGVPPGRYAARGAARARYVATLGVLGLGLGAAMLGLGLSDRLVADASVYNCPPDCGRPPNAVPVANLPRFSAPNGQFSVSHPAPGGVYDVSTGDDGVTARMTTGDRGVMRLFSQPAQGRVARQVVEQLLSTEFPEAAVSYELPNAMVGYQVGYGVAATVQQPGLSAKLARRVIVIAAVKNDLALIALAEGPFHRFSADFGPGPPSAANLEIAMDMGKYVESFTWNGDAPQ